MQLSARACYGTRTLLELAVRWRQGRTSLSEIARKQNVSVPYLTRVMAPLIAAGLVQSARGAHGGVWLLRAPHEINLHKVIELLEGPVVPMACVANSKGCAHSEFCVPRDVWSDLRTAITGVLASITLQDLVEQHHNKKRAKMSAYCI